MVEVTQGFNTGMVYKALLQQANTTNIYDGRKVLADARTNMDYVHIKFEILTELCDDFKKCENCKHSPCVDGKVMLELRDLFYDMEKHYFDMLEAGENFLERLNQEQERIQLMGTEKEIQRELLNCMNARDCVTRQTLQNRNCRGLKSRYKLLKIQNWNQRK